MNARPRRTAPGSGRFGPLWLGVTFAAASAWAGAQEPASAPKVAASAATSPASEPTRAAPKPAPASLPPRAAVPKPPAEKVVAAPKPASPATSAVAAPGAAASAPGTAFVTVPVPADPCELLVKRMPNLSVALCASAMLQATGARSVNGFPLYQRDVSARFQEIAAPDGPKPARRPRVLVVGGIHGDELSSTSLAFHWIAHAMETGADMDWRFLPAVNPDGLLQSRPSRTNARGVDLNRNFPTPRWAQEAPEYWAKRTKKDPRRYPGPAPLSEPETRFLNETMDRWKPDLIVSVHAPYGVLDYDGPSIPPERLGRLFLDRVGIFPGSLGHYGGVHRGVPVVTIELPSAIRTPTNAEMRQMWLDLLRWIGERLSIVER